MDAARVTVVDAAAGVAVLVSLVVVPAGLTYYLAQHGAPTSGVERALAGGVALFPGFLMGGAALWVAARG